MNNPIFAVTLPYKTRCDIPSCRKAVNQIFRTNIEGFSSKFCSPNHANVGEQRWEEKKKLGVRMGVPTSKESEEFVGDNIQELSEGGE